jgi:hypothetical protein
METPIFVAMLTGLFGLISGIVLTYLGSVLKFRKDLEAEYDKDLRNRRLDAYQDLWKLLEILARYDRPKPLNRQTLEELTATMREWYFGTGGLYLSEKTRGTYFDLKRALQDKIARGNYGADGSLVGPDSQSLLDLASLLRASLSQDVGTRKSSPVADS